MNHIFRIHTESVFYCGENPSENNNGLHAFWKNQINCIHCIKAFLKKYPGKESFFKTELYKEEFEELLK